MTSRFRDVARRTLRQSIRGHKKNKDLSPPVSSHISLSDSENADDVARKRKQDRSKRRRSALFPISDKLEIAEFSNSSRDSVYSSRQSGSENETRR